MLTLLLSVQQDKLWHDHNEVRVTCTILYPLGSLQLLWTSSKRNSPKRMKEIFWGPKKYIHLCKISSMIISFKLLLYCYCAIFREWEWPSTKMFVTQNNLLSVIPIQKSLGFLESEAQMNLQEGIEESAERQKKGKKRQGSIGMTCHLVQSEPFKNEKEMTAST